MLSLATVRSARSLAAGLALAALTFHSGAALAAAETSTPLDSQQSVGEERPFGAYLWHNDDGWHFRTHGAPDGTHFTARLATNGTVRDVVPVRDEADDHVRLDDAGHALDARFATYAGVDGVDFRLDDAAWLRVDVRADDAPLPAQDIYLGDDGRHPAGDPFTLRLRDLRVPEHLPTGYTVERDGDRLMLLTHDQQGSHRYTGTLTTTGTIELVDLVRPEKDDQAAVSGDGHSLTFSFVTGEGVDGVVVRVRGAERARLSLSTDGQPTPVGDIHLGARGGSPRHNPFEVRV